MGFDEGHFIFENNRHTYNAGDIVRGKLVFDQNKPKTFRGIYVKAKGYCDVHWTTRHSRRINNRTTHYTRTHSSHETYFELKVYLIGGESGEVTIQPGHYEFPFEIQIPRESPSSYEGTHGHVRHTLKAVVDRKMKFDQEKKVDIEVIKPRDLNYDPYCKEPLVFEFNESYCCWCVSAGSCEVVARAPQAGYCPGQTVAIELDCANRSNVEIDEISFKIKEKIKFIASNNPDTKKEKSTIAALKKGPVPCRTTRNWTAELDIPDMTVRNLDGCSYIHIDYVLEVQISTSGCHTDSEASKRIVIGTIPLREFDINQPVAPLAPYESQHIPLSSQGYPSPYPGNQPPPYPGNNQTSPYPNQGYPVTNQPYPYPNQGYPGNNQPSPYPNQGYPGSNQTSPYPGGAPQMPPYPGVTVTPIQNQPMPSAPIPAPMQDRDPNFPPPYPGNTQMPPLPGAGGESIGFVNPMPYPPGPPPASSPFAGASAPEPSTPDTDKKQPL